MTDVIFTDGDVWYPRSYDFARIDDHFIIRSIQLYHDSEETGLFLTTGNSNIVIFNCDDYRLILNYFTQNKNDAYRFTDEQLQYVNEWYGNFESIKKK